MYDLCLFRDTFNGATDSPGSTDSTNPCHISTDHVTGTLISNVSYIIIVVISAVTSRRHIKQRWGVDDTTMSSAVILLTDLFFFIIRNIIPVIEVGNRVS